MTVLLFGSVPDDDLAIRNRLVTFSGAPATAYGTGPAAYDGLEVRVVDTDGHVIVPFTDVVLTEAPAGSYAALFIAPAVGDYRVVWSSPDFDDIGEPLTVTVAPGARPSILDVALLMRTRTVGPVTGLGGDTGPGDFTTFTSTTRPTAVEVGLLIDQATNAVAGLLPSNVSTDFDGRVRQLVAVQTAVLIELSFFREQADVTVWRDMIDSTLANLRADIDDQRQLTGTRQRFGSIPLTAPRCSQPRWIY